MADWITHLHCAHKANEILKFEGGEAEMFFYGNLLPDINPGWVTEPKVQIMQDKTHFAEAGPSYYWAYQRFYEKYEQKIKEGNPLFIGYLFHLWLDIGIMTEYVQRVPLEDFIIKGLDVREQKWKDMNVYIKPYTYELTTDSLSAIVRESKFIEEIDICEEDLRNVAAKLLVLIQENTDKEYVYFDEETLKNFYDRTSAQFAAFIKDVLK